MTHQPPARCNEAGHRNARGLWVVGVFAAVIAGLTLIDFVVTRPKPIPAEAYAAVEEGRPIVEAIRRFKNEVGVWPGGLDNLVPRYIDSIPSGWSYHSRSHPLGWRLMYESVEVVWIDTASPTWAVGLGRRTRFIRD